MENTMMDLIENFEEEQEVQKFKVKDKETADWVFEKIKQIEAELVEDTTYATKQIEKYQNYIDNQTNDATRRIEYFKYLIEEYIQEKRQENPKFKLKTALGSASITTRKKWNYEDEKVIEFIKANNLPYLRIKEEINKADFKKALNVSGSHAVTEDGEIVEGIEITENESLNLKLV